MEKEELSSVSSFKVKDLNPIVLDHNYLTFKHENKTFIEDLTTVVPSHENTDVIAVIDPANFFV